MSLYKFSSETSEIGDIVRITDNEGELVYAEVIEIGMVFYTVLTQYGDWIQIRWRV